MKTSSLSCVFLFLFIGSSLAASQNTNSTVTLPVEVYKEYLQLKAEPKIPQVTVIEEARVGGTYINGELTLTLRGQSSKLTPANQVLTVPDAVRVADCEGSAIVYRGKQGFSLLPKSKKFEVKCKIRFGDQESLKLDFGKSVLDVRVRVSGAESVEQGGQRVSVLLRKIYKRQKVASTKDAEIIVTPRYHLTVKSDETQFVYRFDLRNPNSRSKDFKIPLRNGEKVSRIDTTASNEWKDDQIELILKPGSSIVTVTGQVSKRQFLPLFDKEEQYLLLEFHPLVALKLVDSPARIGVEQTGMSPTYDASMAFLIGKGKKLVWESKTREVFSSESFAARSARYTVFIPDQGESIVDGSWGLENRGKPSLRYELPGKAVFAASAGKPQVLAKTEKNELFLPLRTGTTNLRVQYELEELLPRPLGIWSTELVRPNVKIPDVGVQVRLGSRHKLVAARLFSDLQMPWFTTHAFVWALLIAIGWMVILPKLGVAKNSLLHLSAIALVCLGTVHPVYLNVAMVLAVLGLFLSYRKRILAWVLDLKAKKKWFAMGVVGSFAVFFLIFAFSTSKRYVRKSSIKSEQYAGQLMNKALKSPSAKGSLGQDQDGLLADQVEDIQPAPAKAEASYLGIPVEQVIPMGRSQIYLRDSAIPEGSPLSVQLLVFSLFTSMFLTLLGILFWLAPFVVSRKTVQKHIVNT